MVAGKVLVCIYLVYLDFYLLALMLLFMMPPPIKVGRHIVLPHASICLSVHLTVPHKLYPILSKLLLQLSPDLFEILQVFMSRSEDVREVCL